jgi:hypothetical protein
VAKTFRPAREVAQDRGGGELWIDHAAISAKDIEWLAAVERLTLWNVKVPPRFLERLEHLWWLDLRGGSAPDIRVADGCKRLRYLQVNQVRGVTDLSMLSELENVELLSLYGLAQLTKLPSLSRLRELRRVEVGQMRSLGSIGPILEAPALEELLIIKTMSITKADVKQINTHAKLASFAWDTVDVPRSRCEPVLAQIDKPQTRAMHASDWFDARRSTSHRR